MFMNNIQIHSLQLKDGKGTAYKTMYSASENSPCKPCSHYKEKPLEKGAVECDYNLIPILCENEL